MKLQATLGSQASLDFMDFGVEATEDSRGVKWGPALPFPAVDRLPPPTRGPGCLSSCRLAFPLAAAWIGSHRPPLPTLGLSVLPQWPDEAALSDRALGLN